MALLLTVLQVVLPIAILTFIGFAWVKRGYDFPQDFVGKLVMNVAVPALVFTALMQSQIDPQALSTLTLAALAGYGVLSLIFWGLTSALRLDRKTFHAPLIFGNTGNVGLPLALFAFGEAGMGYAVVVFAVMIIWHFTIGIWLTSGGGSPWKAVKEPAMIATFLGAVFLWQGWQTPLWLTHSLNLLGQIAIPMMLLMLGVAVARLKARNIGRAVILSLVRVAICLVVALLIGWGFALEPVALAVLVLQLSAPVAVTSYMLATKYGGDTQEVAGLIIISTLLSVITLPLTLAFLI